MESTDYQPRGFLRRMFAPRRADAGGGRSRKLWLIPVAIIGFFILQSSFARVQPGACGHPRQ